MKLAEHLLALISATLGSGPRNPPHTGMQHLGFRCVMTPPMWDARKSRSGPMATK